MNIEQVYIEVMHARLTVNTPTEEKDTLLQAVGMLNGKAEAIREGGRVADSEKIVIMKRAQRRPRPIENLPERRRFGNRRFCA